MLPLLLLIAGLHAQDPVQVRATLRDPEIRAGETTVLRVDVETDGPRAQIERMTRLPPGLELVSTRDYDQRQFSMPGGVRRFVAREFVLRASASGQYRLPALDVIVDNRTYTTDSRLLTVSAAPARVGPEAREMTDGVLLRAWLDADSAFVGEQVTLQVEAMFSQDARLRLRRAPEYEPPSPSGFWIHDLPDPRASGSRRIGNEIYEVQSFRRAFFPLAAGEYDIPPARLEYEMRRGLLYAPETHEIRSDVLPLRVLPLPESGRPPEFTGAVGEYTLQASIEPTIVPAGEAAVLSVEVAGSGNVKALPPPRLPVLDGVEVYPPSEDAATEIHGVGVRGTKRFTWVLIPRETGRLEIPPVEYAYFNPGAGEYEVAETGPMTLRVTAAAAGVGASMAPATLRFVKTEPGGADPLAWVRSPWFALAQGLPLLGLVAALGLRRRRLRGTAVSIRALRRRRRRVLQQLERRAEEGDRGVFADAAAFARAWLADRLGAVVPQAGVAGALRERGVPGRTATAVAGVLDRLVAARFAPTAPAPQVARDLMRALGRVLERVDREAPQPPRRAGTEAPARSAAGAALALVLAAGLTTPAGAAPPPSQDGPAAFRSGVAAFESGRYDDAARAFDRYLEGRPDDAAGWYNLGTAYHRAGHPGYAVWAWLHVPRLAPRDADTRHNLRVAGVPPELVARVAPMVPLRSEELLLLASTGWFLTAAGAVWWLSRGTMAAGVMAGVAALFALAAGAAWLDTTRASDTLIVLESAALRAGPTLQGEPLVQLEPGTGLVRVDRYGDWFRARTTDGAEGWVEVRTAGRI